MRPGKRHGERSRRQFLRGGLTGGMVGGLAAMTGGSAGCGPEGRSRAPGDDTVVDEAVLQGAERLAAVSYTPEERAAIIEGVEQHLALVAARRSFAPGFELAPATTYDPRPPALRLPPQPPATHALAPADAPALPGDEVSIAFAPLAHLGAWLRRKELSSVALTRLYLERLRRLGPELQCVVTLTETRAMDAAKRADLELAAGHDRGPLHGIPWGAKDLFDTAGVETAWGATPFKGRVPQSDAEVVRRLDDAGAVLVAKLSMGALAYGDLWYGGRTKNPWNPAEGSSGSSAGSAAAVAAGLVGFALGTETLGSIVSPSMRCGTAGLRPTFGRVPRTGAMPLCWSLDKVGPLTRHVDDAALVLATINGHDPRDPASLDVHFTWDGRAAPADARSPLRGVRIGRDPTWFEDASEVDVQALETARKLGAEIVDVVLPDLPYAAMLLILQAEAAAAFEAITLDGRDDQLTWQDPEAWPNTFRTARFVSAVDLVQADRLRRHVRDEIDRRLGDVDLWLGPSYADDLLLITNFTGHPSLTLRAGFETRAPRDLHGEDAAGPRHSVPHGITLWGRLFDEGRLCRVGQALETALGVAFRRPPAFG